MSLSSSDTMMKRLILHAILIRERPLMTISVVSSMKLRAKGGIPVLFNSIVRRNFVQPEDASIATDARRAPGEQELPKRRKRLVRYARCLP